jgi:hypothetical protein
MKEKVDFIYNYSIEAELQKGVEVCYLGILSHFACFALVLLFLSARDKCHLK